MNHKDTYHVEQQSNTTHDENVAWLVNDWSTLALDKMNQWRIRTFNVYESFNGL
jgi:hypothetical protein